MFEHSASGVLVVTDTLATSDGEPLMFQTKVRPFAHARLLVAGTGLSDVVAGWVDHLSTRAIFRDIRGADANATATLQHLHRQVVGDRTGPGLTTTIYHFGFEGESETAVRYVYRSTNEYARERVEQPGFGVKPTIDGAAPYGPPDDLDDFVALAHRIRAEQAAETSGRIFVGGELYATSLTPQGVQIVRLHRFDDYEDNWKTAMLRSASPFR